MNSCEGFWSCISPDAWVTSGGTLVGAFLGAFIAGMITLTANKKMISGQEKLRKRDKDDYFRIIAQQFIDQFELVDSMIQMVIETGFEEKSTKEVGISISEKVKNIDAAVDIRSMNPADYKLIHKLLEGHRYISYELIYLSHESPPNVEVVNIIRNELSDTLTQLKNRTMKES
ncbi:hypothetical protein MUO14_15930 [Halobacillus shinanisalinarum]|uniref:Uncharacterized protein n=1 Tax=Halobacillus shinanisalinarum TaxID=2932258 RepID=A0ABY4GVB4_9BACI|nr:hypothetical protein [Halobacillus shinanisalinarum]UOQ91984.1 hypothetical protein MUO14_15930 [Halobacillus shinanisalinarum]